MKTTKRDGGQLGELKAWRSTARSGSGRSDESVRSRQPRRPTWLSISLVVRLPRRRDERRALSQPLQSGRILSSQPWHGRLTELSPALTLNLSFFMAQSVRQTLQKSTEFAK